MTTSHIEYKVSLEQDYTRIWLKLAPQLAFSLQMPIPTWINSPYNFFMQDDDEKIDDTSLFRQHMNDVRPLDKDDRVHHSRSRPSAKPRQREIDEQQVLQDMMSDPVDINELETGEELLFKRAGVQDKTFRKLRRGELALEAELDLHGKTVEEARLAIINFLSQCQKQSIRCIRVIHGKGYGSFNRQPVLKSHVNHWLRQRNEILAFCSARPADGGTGAIYVLLKK